MSETALTEEKISGEKACLRCGGSNLMSAYLEHPIAFCLDHVPHHGRVHLTLKALLCPECGHVEFWMPDPLQIARPEVRETAKV